MKDDLTVIEVRKVRKLISGEFEDSPEKLVKHYKEYQKKFKDRLREPSIVLKHKNRAIPVGCV